MGASAALAAFNSVVSPAFFIVGGRAGGVCWLLGLSLAIYCSFTHPLTPEGETILAHPACSEWMVIFVPDFKYPKTLPETLGRSRTFKEKVSIVPVIFSVGVK